MFKINLASFSDQKEFEFELKKSQISFDGMSFDDGLLINITLTKDGVDSVIAEGHITGTIIQQCSRCLEEIRYPVNSDFACIFKQKSALTQDDIDSDVRSYDKNIIDLYDYLRETMILELPLKALCRDDCKGLCPVCGRNLNNEKCNCSRGTMDFTPFKGIDI